MRREVVAVSSGSEAEPSPVVTRRNATIDSVREWLRRKEQAKRVRHGRAAWNWQNGTMAQWHNGKMAQWHNDALRSHGIHGGTAETHAHDAHDRSARTLSRVPAS